jgi:hypothetical protein
MSLLPEDLGGDVEDVETSDWDIACTECEINLGNIINLTLDTICVQSTQLDLFCQRAVPLNKGFLLFATINNEMWMRKDIYGG